MNEVQWFDSSQDLIQSFDSRPYAVRQSSELSNGGFYSQCTVPAVSVPHPSPMENMR